MYIVSDFFFSSQSKRKYTLKKSHRKIKLFKIKIEYYQDGVKLTVLQSFVTVHSTAALIPVIQVPEDLRIRQFFYDRK